MRVARALLLLGVCLLVSPDSLGGILVMDYENDVFSGNDRGYTNGIRATIIPEDKTPPQWLSDTGRLLLGMDESQSFTGWAWGVDQLIFTPDDIGNPTYPPADRPYAGWLNLHFTLGQVESRNFRRLRLAVGVVGPSSQADEVQEGFHSLTGATEPVGWDTQISDEPTIQLSYDRQWRIAATDWGDARRLELLPSIGGTVGNAKMGVESSLIVRFGNDIPVDFGPPRMTSLAGGSGYFQPTEGFGWYIYSGVGAQYRAHDIFLEGSLFNDRTRSVDMNSVIGEAYFGFACYHGPTRIAYTHIWQTESFDNQPGDTAFGAISISWAF